MGGCSQTSIVRINLPILENMSKVVSRPESEVCHVACSWSKMQS